MRRSLRPLLALLILIAAAPLAPWACAPAGQSLFVIVQLDPALSPDQLQFRVDKAGLATLGPALRPETPGAVLSGEQSVRLSLPSAYVGTVRVTVEALAQGLVVGSGAADAVVRANAETDVVVTVAPGTTCDASSCAGCCAGNLCVLNSLNLCGSGGGTCFACDVKAADRCEGGACRCGTGPACAAGQACVGGACRCDSSTCPSGCCSGNTCLPGDTAAQCGSGGGACTSCPAPETCVGGVCSGCAQGCDAGCCSGSTCNTPSPSQCGLGGAACVACDSVRANGCTAGSCTCGAGPACGAGLACVGGTCVCNATSCPTGCCAANACQAPSPSTCGTGGGACTTCNPATADRCSSAGTCACGGSAPCAAGSTCVGGTCRCDGGACGGTDAGTCNASTCPSGCCVGGVCTPSSPSSCGTGGAACVDCGLRGDSCSNGTCLCRTGAMCPPGTRCTNNGCVCDLTSGCAGCCNGTTCVDGGILAACGVGGAACAICNPQRTDTCTAAGQCKCGTGNSCAGAGAYCDAGVCM